MLLDRRMPEQFRKKTTRQARYALLTAVFLTLGSGAADCQAASEHLAGEQGGAFIRVEGVVHDSTGAVVAGAEVGLRGERFSAETRSTSQGEFAFEKVPVGRGSLRAWAPGFGPTEMDWNSGRDRQVHLEIVLQPAGPAQAVTVTATRTESTLADTPASVHVLSRTELDSTAALTVDDALRQVAGFTLYRRSGSQTANPTSQGVSLRGLGASGASRALVLADGVLLNDPFGGWVYWDRVPRASIESLDVLAGGASGLYGSTALGGVIDIRTRPVEQPTLSLETSLGNESSSDLSFLAGDRIGKWSASLAGEAFQTDGYILVDPQERGKIDSPANSGHLSGILKVERSFAGSSRVFAEGSLFGESRDNGTPFEVNNTRIRQLDLGGDWQWGASALTLRLFGGNQVFNQNFSSIATDRNSETPVRIQRVPATPLGASAQWSRTVGARQLFVAGFDGQDVRGHSAEIGFLNGSPSSHSDAGGRQRTTGVFGEDVVHLTPRWLLTANLRADRWSNTDGSSWQAHLGAPPSAVTRYPDRTETALSPRLAALFQASPKLSFTASAYRSFRAPTLNELYRSFFLGNILTLANAGLRAEHLNGGEAGAWYSRWHQRLLLRGTVFWNQISQPISNVTLSTTPNVITRERENLGSTRSRGVDLQAEGRLPAHLALSGGYEFVDATVLSFAAEPALVGLDIPQVPRQQMTFQVRYTPAVWVVALQGRAIGKQYDDDQNQLPLARYFCLEAYVSRSIKARIRLFAAVENLLDQRYEVERTPLRMLGPPLLARAGLKLDFGGR
jgi:outer membrane receptor protein involved in Fe transport